jgi:hypothetical protein
MGTDARIDRVLKAVRKAIPLTGLIADMTTNPLIKAAMIIKEIIFRENS